MRENSLLRAKPIKAAYHPIRLPVKTSAASAIWMIALESAQHRREKKEETYVANLRMLHTEFP